MAYQFDTKRLAADVNKAFKSSNYTKWKHLAEDLGLHEMTLWRIRNGHTVRGPSMLIICGWLGKPVRDYVQK